MVILLKTVIGLGNSEKLAKDIARKSNAEFIKASLQKFPDGEIYLRIKGKIRKHVYLIQSLNPEPNSALIELIFAAKTAKEIGARRVSAVVPYLAYMRQDRRFRKGECISAKQMAFLLNNCLDRLITVDPHLHRIKSLKQIFKIPAKKLSATSEIAKYIKKNFNKNNSLVVGPDIESYQWAKRIADSIGFNCAIFLKKRFGSRKVKIKVVKELDWKGKNVIIVDDIISSGNTMIETVRELKKRKPRAIYCICVHPIFAERAYERLLKAGAKRVVSCNTIEHNSNKINLSRVIAKEL